MYRVFVVECEHMFEHDIVDHITPVGDKFTFPDSIRNDFDAVDLGRPRRG